MLFCESLRQASSHVTRFSNPIGLELGANTSALGKELKYSCSSGNCWGMGHWRTGTKEWHEHQYSESIKGKRKRWREREGEIEVEEERKRDLIPLVYV